MENMKLFDLQTGKYLELDNDWLYGGRAIRILSKNSTGYYYYRQSEPQEPLKTLCEKTGAVVYGDRYVLFENKECGNIYCEKNKWGTVYYLNKDIYSFIPCPEFNPENDKKATVQMFFSLNKCEDNLISNLFEEYSKSLRGEENGLNKLMELIK